MNFKANDSEESAKSEKAQILELEASRIDLGYKPGWLYYRCKEKGLLKAYERLKKEGKVKSSDRSYKYKNSQFTTDQTLEERIRTTLCDGKRDESYDLNILPISVHRQQIREIIDRKDWKRIRQAVIRIADYCCQFCGIQPNIGESNQYAKLHCHEVWEFDDNTRTQSLVGLQSLCENCHKLKHIDFQGNTLEEIYNSDFFTRFVLLTGFTPEATKSYISTELELQSMRDQPGPNGSSDWKLDVKVLYKIGISPTSEALDKGVRIESRKRKAPTDTSNSNLYTELDGSLNNEATIPIQESDTLESSKPTMNSLFALGIVLILVILGLTYNSLLLQSKPEQSINEGKINSENPLEEIWEREVGRN